MIKVDDKLFIWNNVSSMQLLEENYLPIPKVNWNCNDLDFETKVFASGEANKSSVLYFKYTLSNNSSLQKHGSLFLLIRPFQVNPYYQFLNITGGVGKINSIKESRGKIYVNNDKEAVPITQYNSFGASTFDEGNIVEAVSNDNISQNKSVVDPTKLASGVLEYSFNIKPDEKKNYISRSTFLW